jgi:hypothetical protein
MISETSIRRIPVAHACRYDYTDDIATTQQQTFVRCSLIKNAPHSVCNHFNRTSCFEAWGLKSFGVPLGRRRQASW